MIMRVGFHMGRDPIRDVCLARRLPSKDPRKKNCKWHLHSPTPSPTYPPTLCQIKLQSEVFGDFRLILSMMLTLLLKQGLLYGEEKKFTVALCNAQRLFK